jgi:hypothetical protein
VHWSDSFQHTALLLAHSDSYCVGWCYFCLFDIPFGPHPLPSLSGHRRYLNNTCYDVWRNTHHAFNVSIHGVRNDYVGYDDEGLSRRGRRARLVTVYRTLRIILIDHSSGLYRGVTSTAVGVAVRSFFRREMVPKLISPFSLMSGATLPYTAFYEIPSHHQKRALYPGNCFAEH